MKWGISAISVNKNVTPLAIWDLQMGISDPRRPPKWENKPAIQQLSWLLPHPTVSKELYVKS